MKTMVPLLIALILCVAPAYASDEVQCNESCPEGKKIVSFADGNNTSCSCVDEASMDETVPDPEVIEGPVNTDS